MGPELGGVAGEGGALNVPRRSSAGGYGARVINESRQQRRARERAEAKAHGHGGSAGRNEHDLVQGWSAGADTRIRLATPADVDAVAELVPLAGVELEEDLLGELRTGDGIADALRTGLRSGHDALLEDIAAASVQVADDPRRLFLRSALPLVADRDGEIVGTLVAYPPINVIHRYYTQVAELGSREQQKVLLLGAIGLTRIKAVAVSPGAELFSSRACSGSACSRTHSSMALTSRTPVIRIAMSTSAWDRMSLCSTAGRWVMLVVPTPRARARRCRSS